jgi:GAF domain-containing protein
MTYLRAVENGDEEAIPMMGNRDDPGSRAPRPQDLDAAREELRKLVLGGSCVADFLEELCLVAAAIVPGAHCGFTLDRGGQVISVATNDGVTAQLDEIGHLYGDGPLLEALRTCSRVDMPDLADDDRWRPFPDYALAFGARSGVCLPLVVEGTAIGALSLYAPGARAFLESELEAAQAVAHEAAAGLSSVLRRSGRLVPDERLPRTLATRQVIDQALGVLMHARQISTRDALDVLLDMARTSGRTPAQVASEIVRRASGGETMPST